MPKVRDMLETIRETTSVGPPAATAQSA